MHMLKRSFVLTSCCLLWGTYNPVCFGQDTLGHKTSNKESDSISFLKKNHLTLEFYTELYYSYDLAQPENHFRQPFFYSFNRHNEFTLNLGFVKFGYGYERLRANVGLMAGSYAEENLVNELGVFKNILEANVGYKLSKKKELWIDAGIMPSHLGFESAIGADCWNVTRSIMAENSPYYETGIKLSYISPNQKWNFSALAINGWQQMLRSQGKNSIAFGHQLQFKPNSKLLLNSGSFIGEIEADTEKKMRFFHNFFLQAALSNQLELIADFDFGFQQKNSESTKYNSWYSPALIMRFKPIEKLAIALRVEYYSDLNQVVVANYSNGFSSFGYSINMDYTLAKLLLWRIEARALSSNKAIYSIKNEAMKENYFFTTSFIFRFKSN